MINKVIEFGEVELNSLIVRCNRAHYVASISTKDSFVNCVLFFQKISALNIDARREFYLMVKALITQY